MIELNIFYNDNTLYVNLDEYLDDYVLNKLKKNHELVMTIEDGELMGGYGQNIASFYGMDKMLVKNYGISKAFHTDFVAEELLAENGMSVENLFNEIARFANFM